VTESEKPAGWLKWFKRLAIGVVILFVVLCVAPYFYPLSRYDAGKLHLPHDNGGMRLISGINIYSRLWEPSVPVSGNVLLVHGFGSSTYAWQKIMPSLLSAGFRVVAADVPGFGYSDKNITWSYSHDRNAELLWSLADIIGKENKLSENTQWILVGHSMGGEIVVRMADKQPRRVAKVILAAGAVNGRKFQPVPVLRFPPARRWMVVIIEILSRRPERVSRVLGSAYGRTPTPDELKGYGDPLGVAGTTRAFLSILDSNAGMDGVSNMLKNLSMPVSLIWGEKDMWISTKQGHKVAKLIGRPLHIVPASGHCPMETHPDEFARLLLAEMNGSSGKLFLQ